MSPAAALRAALAAPLGGPLAARFPAPFATVLVADAGEGPELEEALAACAGALVAAGLPAARQLVL
ncbi:MAG TPA: hypothetical protein VGU27_09395, partial [Candidatus Eisenbacteria bacterium]|nr:hypothetical protein [Candidatus Eisenbacteria bacterium]